MDANGKSLEADILGRVMALEQRTRGLHGRVNALEMRFSGAVEGDGHDDTEFVAGERLPDSLEKRVAALEAAVNEKRQLNARRASMLDVTGIVVGLSLLAVGVLLSTNSMGLLRNPLLAFSGGMVILACAVWRMVIK
ncbi:Protein of unknown function (DUF3040) [Methanocella conradii HZ254]|uniref:DUF6752 domain-containing protein n=1 Tax=Methanocella conradii (strain DSM 24694 / JCM 17849 / CGMCC 1.5162 / HZ254) TaxID=1041930 RepID=H8I571_METCZ|nr:DUF6752 domain-containing protein [Methanocella conradii]AFC99268.1 Protein of unknown function (DUF3040) [Methanocella conradii HZ254]MDI6897729.1 hypothetical protein [Methanocella conradii]